jgi:uncharacterized protein (DUF58 family)
LELRAREVVEGYVAGMHRSPYHGFSVEFSQHREYSIGDDLRYVDWKVYGKTDKVYLKQFEEETNLICYLALDASASMSYQGPGAAHSKLEYAQLAAAALAMLVLRQQDSVGLATFDRKVRELVPFSGSPAHLEQVLRCLDRTAGEKPSRTGDVLHELAERFSKRGLVIVLSDLLGEVESTLSGVRRLRHRRHDCIVLHVLDPAEIDFPFDRPTRFLDLEGGQKTAVDPRSIRAAYRTEVQNFLRTLAAGCRSMGADYVLFRTDRPPEVALARYLAARKMRRR